ncbi:MAG TPA: hypothetical protein VG318_10975 [Actinomycetota bacterium]|nr:hypothetical protein [Actinomycetota bacterium]
MGKGGASKRVLVVGAAVAALAAVGASPAQASESECGPAIEAICDMVRRQVDHVVYEAEAATDYALFWGDKVIAEVNNAYYTVRCTVLEECS